MTLEVEDGTGKTNSVTYVTAAELTTYATGRGITLTAADDTAKEALLVRAMDYLESLSFIGDKCSKEQALQWPRVNAYMDGYAISYNEIPTLLKHAQMENAIGIDTGVDPLATEERKTIKEKVGDIEVEYDAAALSYSYLKAAETKAHKLVRNSRLTYRV